MRYSAVFAFLTLFAGANAVSCDGVQQWQISHAYTTGDQVVFNNNLYTAKQLTDTNPPPTDPDQWTSNGACTPPINNKVSCAGIPAWSDTILYATGGNTVYNIHRWVLAVANGITPIQGVRPGNSGVWQDLGACA